MEKLGNLIGGASQLLPLIFILAGTAIIIWGVNRVLFERMGVMAESKLPRQVTVMALAMVGVVMAILALPVGEETKGHLLSLLGLLLTAIIAMSSTTLASNAMAGLMLRAMRSFRTGDFVRVGTHFGRVTEIGLFHTEIQTSNRDLTALPNAFFVSNPATVVRHSGTIIETTLSLGYDVPHHRAEELLLKAAKSTGLEDPFVLILELGNFSITYRIAGFLSETKRLVSAGTVLRREVLDTLHRAGVEIASPTLMSQRRLGEGEKLLPKERIGYREKRERSLPEDIVFDKAEEAERFEQLRIDRKELVQQLKDLESSRGDAPEEERKEVEADIASIRLQLEDIDRFLGKSE
ncbi:MAG: mechanosensitive ion channel family protein [Sulfuritalea sp.]|nr:mechanosensitive ion channel family protein [Sulfuritalea sp.]